MSSEAVPDYSAVVSATGFLRPRASRSLDTFHDHLIISKRMLALVGAGLSSPSGIPTYRDADGVWKTHDVTQLCTPGGLEEDPALVWTFELEGRSMMMSAQPNVAHRALASLATKNLDFLTLTMNIDDLSERAGHFAKQLPHLHGSIFDVKCSKCDSCISKGGTNDAIKAFLGRDIEARRHTTWPCGAVQRDHTSWNCLVYGIHTTAHHESNLRVDKRPCRTNL
jgi:hypothetical protein